MRQVKLTKRELRERINLNHKRLQEEYYRFENIYSPKEYDWPGDKEGRALLAFACHFEMTGRIIDCMSKLVASMPDHFNEKGYFGDVLNVDAIDEQQLSGHNWVLRGLCKYADLFHDCAAAQMADRIVKNLYLPLIGRIRSYPVQRDYDGSGGVSGSIKGIISGWKLSTDVGCAFMSIDGLAHYYEITGNEDVLRLLDEMIETYQPIDKVKLKAQTHCTLTAARGMLRLYGKTAERKYLRYAKAIFDLYEESGMTLTYQNFNWWGRKDTWTEPCAIVDSLILSLELWKNLKEDHYRTMARRIFHNGLASAQRPNGGAGTDSTVCDSFPVLRLKMYEAYFCCTMRLAEGLLYALENRDELHAEQGNGPVLTKDGTYMNGDILYGIPNRSVPEFGNDSTAANGLRPLIKYYKISDETAKNLEQKIVF